MKIIKTLNYMKKLFLFILLFVPLLAQAYDAKINGIYYNFNGDEATVTGPINGYSGSVTIPSSVTYNGKIYSVTSIGEDSFSYCGSLTSVTIPHSITTIGAGAFYSCNITSLTIPSSVTNIGSLAFVDCGNLVSIAVEDGNPIYDSRGNCNAIIATSSNTLVLGCKNTVVPNSVIRIGTNAFNGCSGLSSVSIPNSVTSIGFRAFSGCYHLASVTIPSSVTHIEDYAFYYCKDLASVTIPSSVTHIGRSAFDGCMMTEGNFVNYSSCNSDDMWGMLFCEEQADGLLIRKNQAWHCRGSATSVTIPSSVIGIRSGAFGNCLNLTSVTIPNSVTYINAYAFHDCCSLGSITIPYSVTSIGDDVFSRCSSLTSLTNLCKVPQTGNGNLPTTCTVHVIRGYKDVYKNSIAWSAYNIVDDIDTSVKVSSISLSATSLEVKIGDEFELTATVLPDDAENKEVEWTSSNPSVVFPIGETWYASGEGTATITATAKDGSGVSASCTVTVVSEDEDDNEDTDIASIDNTIYLEHVEGYVGTQVTLSVKMKNAVDNIASYQFNICLPEGITVVKDPEDPDFLLAELSTERTTSRKHNTFEVTEKADGSILILCASTSNYSFSGNDGEVCRITVSISDDVDAGDYPIILRNILLADSQMTSQTYKTEYVKSTITVNKYKRGDTNGDGDVNVGDYNTLVNYIKGNTDAGIESNMDVSGDGEVNVGDLNTLVNIIKKN